MIELFQCFIYENPGALLLESLRSGASPKIRFRSCDFECLRLLKTNQTLSDLPFDNRNHPAVSYMWNSDDKSGLMNDV